MEARDQPGKPGVEIPHQLGNCATTPHADRPAFLTAPQHRPLHCILRHFKRSTTHMLPADSVSLYNKPALFYSCQVDSDLLRAQPRSTLH